VLTFVITAVLVFVLNISATTPIHACKFQSKQEDVGSGQNGTLKTFDTFVRRFQLGQYTPHAKRFVFDPGGPFLSFVLHSVYEDARKRKLKTLHGFITTDDATLPTLILADDLADFSAETPGFFSRSSLTGDGQDLNPPGGVRPA